MRKDELDFLKALLAAHGTSGYETSVSAVWRDRVSKFADKVETDALGNTIATLNPARKPKVLLAGHADEIGFQVTHIDDNGFLSFGLVGGHDNTLISGRRVLVHTERGPVGGVTGKKAIHLMTEEERKAIPKVEEIWIDIGAKSKNEAASLVRIGDSVTHDAGYQELRNDLIVCRALDDRTGAFVAAETLIALAKGKRKLAACVVAVATVQEEIGARGAVSSTYGVDPDVGICIDVTHATDSPGIDLRKVGETKLGGGPRLPRGASVNDGVFRALCKAGDKAKVPYQIGAQPGVAPNDTRSIQLTRSGVATGTVGIPLRYMHTPSEVVSLKDLVSSIKLLAEFCGSLKSKSGFVPG